MLDVCVLHLTFYTYTQRLNQIPDIISASSSEIPFSANAFTFSSLAFVLAANSSVCVCVTKKKVVLRARQKKRMTRNNEVEKKASKPERVQQRPIWEKVLQ